MRPPKVSIVIPCYNHADFVSECIESVLNQDYENIELIIIDDGSVDESPDIIKSYSEKIANRFERFLIITRANKGLCTTLNEALAWSEGDFFSVIASDDFMLPWKTSVQTRLLMSDQSLAAVFGGTLTVDAVSKVKKSRNKATSYYDFDDVILRRAALSAPTAQVRRSSLVEVGGYDESLAVEDFDLWLKLSYSGYRLMHCGVIVSGYRDHNSNASKRKLLIWNGVKSILQKYNRHPLYSRAMTKSIIIYAGDIGADSPAEAIAELKNVWRIRKIDVFRFRFIKIFFLSFLRLVSALSLSIILTKRANKDA